MVVLFGLGHHIQDTGEEFAVIRGDLKSSREFMYRLCAQGCHVLNFFRSTPKSRPNNIYVAQMSVRTYVRLSKKVFPIPMKFGM